MAFNGQSSQSIYRERSECSGSYLHLSCHAQEHYESVSSCSGEPGLGRDAAQPRSTLGLCRAAPCKQPGGGPAHCRERTSHLAAVRLTEVTGLPACSRGWELSILPTVSRSSCAQTWRIFGISCVIKGTLRSSPGASKAELPLKDPLDPTTFKHLIHPRSFPSIWLNEVAEFLLAMTQNITQTFILPKFIN